MPLTDLIQWIGTSFKTGRLELVRGKLRKQIFFEKGSIVLTGTNNPKEYFGTYLTERRLLTEKQLEEAVKKQGKDETLAYQLVSNGLIVMEMAVKYLEDKIAEDVFEVFLWTDGKFSFSLEPFPAKKSISVSISSLGLVMEGVRRLDEWNRIKPAFPNDKVILRITDDNDVFEKVDLDIEMGTLIPLIDGEKTIEEIVREHAGTRFEVTSKLFKLYRLGILEISEVGVEETEEEKIKDFISEIRKLRFEKKFLDALNVADDALKKFDDNIEILAEHKTTTNDFKKFIFDNYFTLEDTPFLWTFRDRINELGLGENELFLVNKIAQGNLRVGELIEVSPINDIESLRILRRLSETKIIGFKTLF